MLIPLLDKVQDVVECRESVCDGIVTEYTLRNGSHFDRQGVSGHGSEIGTLQAIGNGVHEYLTLYYHCGFGIYIINVVVVVGTGEAFYFLNNGFGRLGLQLLQDVGCALCHDIIPFADNNSDPHAGSSRMQINNQISVWIVFGTQLRIELTRSNGFPLLLIVVIGVNISLQFAHMKFAIEIGIDKASILLKRFGIGQNGFQLERRKALLQDVPLFF